MRNLFVGLISGTSIDGVDAVLAEIEPRSCRIVAADTTPYPRPLAERVKRLIEEPVVTLEALGALDVGLGRFFGECTLRLIADAGLAPTDIEAIGHHGQTVFHRPDGEEPFTMQIGDPSSVAAVTGITTVADFRRLDMALGGQGAPMVPAFHEWAFADTAEPRVILNIGGIANVTVLTPGAATRGFDTGPGNTLLDHWIGRSRGEPFDADGRWAASGRSDPRLLEECLSEPYLAIPPPKSTGRELFNAAWLEARLAKAGSGLAAEDVQATLTDFTAHSIANALAWCGDGARLVVCGGGAHNAHLISRIATVTGRRVDSTQAFGIAPDWVEGAAFAWLARARLTGARGNIPTVTGARQPATLGGIYYGGSPAT